MKCTILDLARELQLSRNTVSKALRGSSEVSEKTRNRVLQKARAMRYLPLLEEEQRMMGEHKGKGQGRILFLSRTHAEDSEFWSAVLYGVQEVLKDSYPLTVETICDSRMRMHELPPVLNEPDIRGVILAEICDKAICTAVAHTGLPTVTIDMPRNLTAEFQGFDVITMENCSNIRKLVELLVKKGVKRFAFVGDIYSQNAGKGFQERYEALKETLRQHNLILDQRACFLHETTEYEKDFAPLVERLGRLLRMPEVYFCGNDWIAIQLLNALHVLGYRVPEDVRVVGFDNIAASAHTKPPLATIATPKEYLGRAAARQILERISCPDAPVLYAQYGTELILRESVK